MGFIKKIFGSSSVSKKDKKLPWLSLSTLPQINVIEEKSKTKCQVIFKHSTKCGISRMVMNQFISIYNFSENDIDLYYLDLLSFREVSNEVGVRFQVMHQSPQILVIRNGIAITHASHGAINDIDLAQYI